MTARLRYDMTCDGDGCTATFTIGSRTASPMRESAARQGWRLTAGPKIGRMGLVKTIDLCPSCASKAGL